MYILGIDEVGRGCWAGPLVVGAVILGCDIPGLNDSKLIKKSERIRLASIIKKEAKFVGLGWVSSSEVDALGLTKAMRLGVERAISGAPKVDQIIIDGSVNYLSDNPRAENLIKADQTVPSVSAASIVAKVARDKHMAKQALLFPGYGFENHVGYGTVAHKNALDKLGLTDLHRLSYKPIKALADGAA